MNKIFFAFFFNIFNEKALAKVSIVFPDFEMIIKRILDKFFPLNAFIFFSFKSLKNKLFFYFML